MKKILCFIFLVFLTSCVDQKPSLIFSSNSNSFVSEEIEHDYSEISKYRISWSEIFNLNIDSYYIYLFSRTCSHCSLIKNKIVEYALKHENIFFIEDGSEIIFKTDVNYTIGSTSAENLAILGFPSLLKISNKILVKNLAGTDKVINELNL